MFMTFSVAAVCALFLIAGLLRLACRYRKDLWITSDDAILCLVAPVMILLATFGALSLGWRVTHGGFAAVSGGGWLGAVIVAAIAAGLWLLLAPRIRAGGRKGADSASLL